MEVIIYLVVSVAVVFVPYYVGRLCIKDFGGNVFIDWFFGLSVSFLMVAVILGVIATSNLIINAI
jgi:hypothetical protein